ncbi:MAG: hypothetical protein GC192_01115 [Bacteroidetes bacterium]|nr:hypothetical protein [Bacteroidota bacterium]
MGIAVGSGISRNQHEKRPIIVPNQDDYVEFSIGDWLEIVKKDGRIVEGKYLEASYIAWEGTDSIPTLELKSIEIDILGRKNNETVMLNDIDHIVLGYKSDGPTVLGGVIGGVIDVVILTMAAIKFNKQFE